MKAGDWIKVFLSDRIIFGYVNGVIDQYIYVRKIKVIYYHNLETVHMYRENQSVCHQRNVRVWGSSLLNSDYNELINMAIDQNDRNWFNDLAERIQQLRNQKRWDYDEQSIS